MTRVCSYLGSRPDSAMNDRMTAFVKLKGESFFAMMISSLAQLVEYLDMLFGQVYVSGIRLRLKAAAACVAEIPTEAEQPSSATVGCR